MVVEAVVREAAGHPGKVGSLSHRWAQAREHWKEIGQDGFKFQVLGSGLLSQVHCTYAFQPNGTGPEPPGRNLPKPPNPITTSTTSHLHKEVLGAGSCFLQGFRFRG